MRAEVLRNSAANFAGGALPALVSLAVVPIIVGQLGETEYGLLALIVAIVGYFAILDVNVTAGSVKFLAEYHAKGDMQRVRQLVVFGVLIYGTIGLVGGTAIVVAAPLLVSRVFEVPSSLRDTGVDALRLGGIAFLFGQLQFYLQSVPQALRRYDVSARYEAAFGVAVSLLSALVVLLGGGLLAVVVLRLAASVVNVALLSRTVRRLLPGFAWSWPDAATARSVLGFSGYAYLSRMATITYLEADKLIIGALVGMQALTLYVVPFTLVNRVFMLTHRISAVLFPTASALAAGNDMEQLKRLYLVAVRYTVFLNGAICVLLAVLAHTVLVLWMGQDFADRSGSVLQILVIAAFVSSFTNLPSLVNDGLGHPAITGSFAVTRTVLGAGIAYLLVGRIGIEGAAISQLVVAIVFDSAFLLYVHGRTVPVTFRELLFKGYGPTLPATGALGLIGWLLSHYLMTGLAGDVATGLLLAGSLGVLGYRLVIRREEKVALRDWISARKQA